MQRMLCGGALLLAVSGAWAQSKTIELKYSKNVLPEQVLRLNKDLVYLDKIALKETDGELTRILKVQSLNNDTVKAWLAARAGYVIDENHILDLDKTIFLTGESLAYPNPDQMPDFAGGAKLSAEQGPVGGEAVSEGEVIADEQAEESQVVMSNIGGLLYLVGKQAKQLVSFKVDGVGDVPVKSARIGIFKIGAGLFRPLAQTLPPESIEDRVHSTFRLGTLLHESRHGDGTGKTMLFGHAICPFGHDYMGMPACDTPANGPYRIEALFVKAVREACSDCDAQEAEILNLLQLDNEHRVLSPVKAGEAPTPPKDDLCKFMENLQLKPEFCAPEGGSGEVIEWNDDVESI